jgi:hypothetical protein
VAKMKILSMSMANSSKNADLPGAPEYVQNIVLQDKNYVRT